MMYNNSTAILHVGTTVLNLFKGHLYILIHSLQRALSFSTLYK